MPAVTIAKAANHVTSITGYRVPSSTIRTWCLDDRFAGFLSDDANPPAGSTRYFTPHDLEILTRIAEYRRQNLSYDEIAENLTKPPSPPVDQPVESPQEATDEPSAAIAPARASDTIAIVQTTSAQFEPRFAEIDQRLRTMESQNRWMIALVAGFLAGAVLIALVALLIAFAR